MAVVARSSVGGLAPVCVGLYAWAASVSFGLVVADVAYASVVLGTALLWLPVLLPAGLLGSGAPLRLAIAGGVSVLAVLAFGKLDRTC
jgi:hypothetical protein